MFDPSYSTPILGLEINVPESNCNPLPGITLCTVPGLFVAFIVTLPTPLTGFKVIFVPATKDVTRQSLSNWCSS